MRAPLLPLALLWIAGLLLGERAALAAWPWLAAAGVVLLCAGYAQRGWPTVTATRTPLYVGLLAVALLLGGARGAAHRPQIDERALSFYNESGDVALRATIVRYPERRGAYTRYELTAHALQTDDGPWQPVRGRFLVNLSPYPAYQYGDALDLYGELVTPPVLDDFDYRAFLAHKGIFALLRNGHAERVAESRGAPLYEALFAIRRRAETTLQRLLPEPHAALMAGILLGIESGIPDPVMEAFNTTGTTHVLVISGSNFAILAALFLLAGQRLLGEKRGALLALLAIALYAMLVGGDPPVVRAALMGGFATLALLLRRQGVALNTLALAVILMSGVNSGQLYDVGFQLSALATLGLILFVPPLTERTDRLLARVGLGDAARGKALGILSDALLITVAAQIITTPLIVGTFGRFSIVSLLSNLLIVPVQGWLMISGALATVVGMIWLPLGRLLAWLPYAGIGWTLAVVRWSATLPYASIAFPTVPAWLIWLGYALGAAWWWRRSAVAPAAPTPRPAVESAFPPARRWLPWLALLVAALLPWWVARQLPDGKLHLYMLDIGQGDALLIVAPDGKQILIDGGPDPVPLLTALGDRLPPWDRTIELLVLSHADADHLGGFPELLSRYRAAEAITSGQPHDTALYNAWAANLATQHVAPVVARPGQRWELGRGAALEIIGPEPPPFEGLNNNGVVMMLRYDDFCALLTGDIEAEAEARLLQRGAVGECELLKVGHHGSRTSTTEDFLAAVQPRIALISVGIDNKFGHPHPDVVERLTTAGVTLFRTDEQGTIHLWSDGQQLWVETER
ncbi:MAG: DNA internalization-related competence protein ComEC/Rec2 [Anaerolineales bacterium]|nr:DNA internalization-related competence protein ComEC/Rec2 [Anaerolineales bacterium]MCB9128760.1 DNA internalization-related competence protein ComEC/Rec2 [Ardenticatenales bacterium]